MKLFSLMNKYKNLCEYNNLVKQLCGQSKVFDIFLSRLLLKVPYHCYVDFAFYKTPWRYRKQFIYNEYTYALKYNPGVTRCNHDDKRDLMRLCMPYFHRKVVSTNELSFAKFKDFTNELSSLFYKPFDGDGGKGIMKYEIIEHDDSSLKKIYDKIISSPTGILEETIKQHPEMNVLHPNLVQTIRFLVFKHKDGPKIIFATLRTSQLDNAIVDNASAGGIMANINLETGKIQTNAFAETIMSKIKDGTVYLKLIDSTGIEKHPVTGTAFKGFKIPYFSDAKKIVIEMASNVNFYNRRFLGFDVAISETGPVIIEVNTTRPGINQLWQIPMKNLPLRPLLEKELKE